MTSSIVVIALSLSLNNLSVAYPHSRTSSKLSSFVGLNHGFLRCRHTPRVNMSVSVGSETRVNDDLFSNYNPSSAFLFPGQGAQAVGMGAEAHKVPAAAALFSQANHILGYDLLDVCTNGPKEKLDSTVLSQVNVFSCVVMLMLIQLIFITVDVTPSVTLSIVYSVLLLVPSSFSFFRGLLAKSFFLCSFLRESLCCSKKVGAWSREHENYWEIEAHTSQDGGVRNCYYIFGIVALWMCIIATIFSEM
ncbi:hypothetical protein RND81_06G109200 [Saponaria officinalis]|uniref:Uncharacterized protein n=1 Tax=Saponaria officinalis TaxID=3572 RepID=A0AAW1K9U3_SAPOF